MCSRLFFAFEQQQLQQHKRELWFFLLWSSNPQDDFLLFSIWLLDKWLKLWWAELSCRADRLDSLFWGSLVTFSSFVPDKCARSGPGQPPVSPRSAPGQPPVSPCTLHFHLSWNVDWIPSIAKLYIPYADRWPCEMDQELDLAVKTEERPSLLFLHVWCEFLSLQTAYNTKPWCSPTWFPHKFWTFHFQCKPPQC